MCVCMHIYICICRTPQGKKCSPRFCWCLRCFASVLGGFWTQNQDPRSKIPTRLLSKILDWYSDKDVLANPKFKIFHKTSVQILDLGSWFWEGMHSLAFSGSDKIALNTFVSVTSLVFNLPSGPRTLKISPQDLSSRFSFWVFEFFQLFSLCNVLPFGFRTISNKVE